MRRLTIAAAVFAQLAACGTKGPLTSLPPPPKPPILDRWFPPTPAKPVPAATANDNNKSGAVISPQPGDPATATTQPATAAPNDGAKASGEKK